MMWGWGGEGPLQIGRQVHPNELLIVLPDTSVMLASVQVHESLASRIKPGLRATVKVEAAGGKTYNGTVESIGVLAESGGWRDPNLREYRVKIALDIGCVPPAADKPKDDTGAVAAATDTTGAPADTAPATPAPAGDTSAVAAAPSAPTAEPAPTAPAPAQPAPAAPVVAAASDAPSGGATTPAASPAAGTEASTT